MLNLYRQQIIERYKNPQFAGTVDHPTHTAEGANMVCGDEISWTAQVENEHFTELRHTTRACAICTASADLLAEQLTGQPVSTAEQLNTEQITELVGIPLSPTRLKCALLPLETLKQALKKD